MSSERPWTPGPWHYNPDADGGWVYANGGATILIADCDHIDMAYAHVMANTALIASAPTLYDSLAAMVAEWEAAGLLKNVTLANAKAALAMARGEGVTP